MTMFCKNTLLALLLLCLAAVPSLRAQGFGLAPGTVDLKFTPGEPVAFDLTFTNGSNAAIEMHASVTDWGFDEKGDKTFPPAGTLPRSAATWVELVPQQFTVGPGAAGKIRVVITPPPKSSGGFYCVVFAESKPVLAKAATEQEKGSVYANFRLGTLVMLAADKTQEYRLEVAAPKITLPTATKPLSVEVALANQGNVHVFPRGEMAILGANRKMVAHVVADQIRLLPEQKGHLSLSWAGEFAPGSYTALVTVIYGDNKLNTQEVPFTVEGGQ